MKSRGSRISLTPVQGIVLIVVAIVVVLLGWRLAVSMFDFGTTEQLQGRGLNNDLQLGGDDKTRKVNELTPLELSKEVSEQKFVAARAAHHHTLLLNEQGEVYTIGDTSPPSGRPSGDAKKVIFPYLNDGERIVQIDASRDHNIVVTSEGRVYTWGSNYNGQLGEGSNTDRVDPLLVEGLPKAKAVAAGYRHSAVIAEDGSIWGWGGSCSTVASSQAELMIGKAAANIVALGGYGSTNQADLMSNHAEDCTTQASTFVQSKTPKKLSGMGESKAIELSAGYGHLLVRDEEGNVYSAGCNTYKQLGRTKAKDENKNDLAKVELPSAVTQVSAGFRHSAVLLEDGRMWAWGYNGPDGGALLAGGAETTLVTPTEAATGQKYVSIEAAHDTTFAITDQRKLLGWGQDDAKAFWPGGVAKSAVVLGEFVGLKAAASGSMWHMIVQEAQS